MRLEPDSRTYAEQMRETLRHTLCEGNLRTQLQWSRLRALRLKEEKGGAEEWGADELCIEPQERMPHDTER